MNKTLATICAILFTLSAVTAMVLFNFDCSAFTAETYQKAFAREDFYNKLPAVMAEAMTNSGADQSQFPVVIQGMSREAWEGFFRSLLPPEMLRVMGDDMLNSAFAYINRETDSIQLNLAPLKVSLASETGVQAVLSLLGTLPACDLFQIGQMTLNLFSGGQIELCNPPADLHPMLAPVIQGQLQFTASTLPDQLTLVTASPQNDPRQRLEILRLFMRFSLILPLIFLLTLTALAVRSLSEWLMWWGIPSFVTGASAYLTGLLGAPIFGSVLQRILVNRMPDYLPLFLLDFASDFASAMVRALLNPVMWQGLVLAVLGVGMAVIGYLLNLKKIGTG